MAKTNHLTIKNVYFTPWTKEGSNLKGFANVEFEFSAAPGNVISFQGIEVKTITVKATGESKTSAFFPQKKVGESYKDVYSLRGEAQWEIVDAIMAKVNGGSASDSGTDETSKVNAAKTLAAKKKPGWGRD